MEVLDRSFAPPILVIEEGDRVWWTWNKEKVGSDVLLPAGSEERGVLGVGSIPVVLSTT